MKERREVLRVRQQVAALRVFEQADFLAKRSGLKDVIWSAIAFDDGGKQTRITEYRQRLHLLNQGNEFPTINIPKITLLVGALEEIFGKKKVQKIRRLLKKVEAYDSTVEDNHV